MVESLHTRIEIISLWHVHTRAWQQLQSFDSLDGHSISTLDCLSTILDYETSAGTSNARLLPSQPPWPQSF